MILEDVYTFTPLFASDLETKLPKLAAVHLAAISVSTSSLGRDLEISEKKMLTTTLLFASTSCATTVRSLHYVLYGDENKLN